MLSFFDALVRYEIELWDALDGAVQRSHGLSLARLQALRVIRERGGTARVQDIADDLGITVGATSKLVDRLEADGTARREPNPADRRSSLIALTESGADVLAAGVSTFQAVLSDSIPPAVVDSTELSATTTILQTLLDHLQTGAKAGGQA